MSQFELLNRLLQQEPTQVYAWIQDAWEGSEKVPEGFNWLGLAEVATSNATSERGAVSSRLNLDWAKVAISIYHYLIGAANPKTLASLEDSMMHLKAYCIEKCGVVANDPVLDIDQIVQWFFHNLELSPEEVKKKIESWRELIRTPSWNKVIASPDWKGLSVEDMRELRRIKNKLSVLKSLSACNLLPPKQEVHEWLALYEQLP